MSNIIPDDEKAKKVIKDLSLWILSSWTELSRVHDQDYSSNTQKRLVEFAQTFETYGQKDLKDTLMAIKMADTYNYRGTRIVAMNDAWQHLNCIITQRLKLPPIQVPKVILYLDPDKEDYRVKERVQRGDAFMREFE